MSNTKKSIVLAAAFAVCLSFQAHAQVISAPVLETLLGTSLSTDVAHYAEEIAQMIDTVTNTYNQFQNALRMEKMALDNLQGLGDVGSWEDFTKWADRQQYLAEQAVNKFGDLGVNIGGQTYKLSDITQIPDLLRSGNTEEWDNEFSEAQKREMWLTLGLSPANYVYAQSWKAREDELARNLLTKRAVVNEENMVAIERSNDILQLLEDDKLKSEDEKMGEKALAEMSLEIAVDTNLAIRQMAYDMAEANERELLQEKANAAPPNPPRLSETWDYDPFGSITE
jgi:hypothetical protein